MSGKDRGSFQRDLRTKQILGWEERKDGSLPSTRLSFESSDAVLIENIFFRCKLFCQSFV